MSVPPRWRLCPRKGKLIAKKFLPFKTPLSAEYDRDLSEEHRFPPSMLISYTEALPGGCRMGLVIDLTKTRRYYDERELIQCGIGHVKITCEGYGAAPDVEQVTQFITICKKFFEENPNDIIGVHCTHGFNRTGFLIVAYLTEVECWDLDAAVSTFATSRSPGIYKEHYLQELSQRYSDGEMTFGAPPLPDWCFEEEEVNSGGEEDKDKLKATAAGNNGGGAEKQKKKHRRHEQNNEAAHFAVPLDQVHVVGDPLRSEIQTACQDYLKWEHGGFPGGQPVSMDVQNIRLLSERPYRVSWKADGTRYIMYIKDRQQIYLINRDNSVFKSPDVTFLSRKRHGEHLKECVADSELVIDKVNGMDRPRLLIYDIMIFEGSSDVSQCDHARRMLCIERELIQPREEGAKVGLIDKSREPFSIRAKQFWDVSETRMVLDSFIPKLTHENDGLIFNPLDQPCLTGKCEQVLKWKPAELNSVDFRLNILTHQGEGMLKEKVGQLIVGSGSQTVMFSHLDLKLNREAREYDKKIIECSFENNKWKFLRVRNDKSFPNSYDTAMGVCASIMQPVTKEWLLEVCEKYRWRPGISSNQHGSSSSNKRTSSQTDNDHTSTASSGGSSNGMMPPPKRPPTRHLTTPTI